MKVDVNETLVGVETPPSETLPTETPCTKLSHLNETVQVTETSPVLTETSHVSDSNPTMMSMSEMTTVYEFSCDFCEEKFATGVDKKNHILQDCKVALQFMETTAESLLQAQETQTMDTSY